MSETNTLPSIPTTVPTPPKAPRPDLTKVKPYLVTRNGVSKSLTPFAGSRKAWDGVVYQSPQVRNTEGTSIVDDPSFIEDLNWYGKDNILRIINVFSRRMSQDYHRDAIPDTDNEAGYPVGSKAGIFVESRFISSMEKFATSSLRISELVELYEDAVKVYTSASSELINEVVAAAGDTTKIAEIKNRFTKLADTVNQYKMEIEERRNRKSKEEQTETVTPE